MALLALGLGVEGTGFSLVKLCSSLFCGLSIEREEGPRLVLEGFSLRDHAVLGLGTAEELWDLYHLAVSQLRVPRNTHAKVWLFAPQLLPEFT